MVDHIILNRKKFTYKEICNKDFDREKLSPFEIGTLEFCSNWLNGQEYFELTTSGSTGTPKPIKIGRKQMEASAALTIEKFGLAPKDRLLICMDTAYIAGKMMLVRGLEGNMAMTVITPTSDPFRDMVPETAFEFTALVPFQLKTILEGKEENKAILDRMKAIIIGGGAVNEALEAQLQQIKAPVYSTYAMTETVSHIALRKLNGQDKEKPYHTLPDVNIGLDARGCLTINAKVTNFETIVTNDLVTIVDENSFIWEGRIDNVINSGGIKIHTEQLENEVGKLLHDLAINKRFFIAGLPDESLGEKVVLILEGEPLESKKRQELIGWFKKVLPAYHIPKGIYYLAKFIETKTGKIQRKKTLDVGR